MLFAGPRGVGKFTLARMFAQAANCERLRDDFCGECDTCLRIGATGRPAPLIEQGLAERGESADAATVERVPLILETHPDVWAVVPDPVRLKSPVARPVLHVGQLRAVQRAAYFKPEARRRVFILDGVETMRWDHANIFLKILEEPPETRDADSAGHESLRVAADDPFALPAVFLLAAGNRVRWKRSCANAPQIDRRASANWPRNSPKAARAWRWSLICGSDRIAAFGPARPGNRRARAAPSADLFAQTAQLAKGQKVPFETVLELLYSLLTDLLEISAGCKNRCFAIRSSERNWQL